MIIVQVTADDIAQGKPSNYFCCPVAIALSRKLRSKCSVGTYWINVPNKAIMLRTPDQVSKFIVDFDTHKPVEPFEFELDIP